MVIRYLWERNFLITFTSLSIVFVLVLSELATSICAKTVQMTTVGESHSMCLTARYRNNLLIIQCLYSRWIRLVWLILRVLWQISDVIQA